MSNLTEILKEKTDLNVNSSLGKVSINDEVFVFISTKDIIKNGYGSCRSCSCPGYRSRHDGTHYCKDCGHHYDRHRD